LTQNSEIAIVGMGPTGVTLANLLANRGLSVAIFEKQSKPYALPRAVHFDGEVMRVFQSIGLGSEISDTSRVNIGMLFKDLDSNILIDWSRSQTIGPMGWYESYRFHQPDLETVLQNGLYRFSNVKNFYNSAVRKISDDGENVTIELESGERHTSQFLIGCDGAQSNVREFLNEELVDLGFMQKWLVIDLILKNDRPDLGNHTVQICDPNSPMTYVRGTGKRRRWEMRLTDETVSKISVEDVWNKLVKWISPDDAEIERSAIYTFKSSLVKKWSRGNVFLAGDAAHLMPPFMGQGMCAGIRDVANLAWKLAAVINGADKAILNTYESERSPNVREFIDLTVRLGQIINQTSKSQKETTKMESILPSLGPGLGLRDNIEGQLAPQFLSIESDKADDLNPNGFYPISNQKNGMKLKGVEPWLNENNIASALVRPDGYILETVSKNKMLNNINDRFDPQNNDLIKAVPSRKFIG
jgi:3-(3-hydroxy-phenyl)propionate hydroxylase